METIKIFNDFLHSPIWTYDEDGIPTDDPPLIANDSILQDLCKQAEEMYFCYFEFDSHDVACWFDHEKEKAEKDQMLDIINKILARLNEINDGSFIVEEYVSKRLKKLYGE